MTKTTKIIIDEVCWVIFSYLWIAFVTAEPDPLEWLSIERAVMMFVIVVGGFSICTAIATIDSDDKPKTQ